MIQNRYLVVQMIGKGGMGEVYLAVDQRLGSAVALKRTMFKENEGLATAFEREARILGRLRHPVLPKVIDHFSEGPDQYLVMEHISGEDLGKRLESAGKPFPLSWVMFWADQLLDALNYLHSHEPPIVHRDIKPENLKLTDDNHIVLLDFGLSKDFDSNSGTSSLKGTGSVVGYSPYFASMEQVRGTGTDARSDIYSFSATMYQLLTNTIPPDSLTRADAILGGSPDPLKPISAINPEVSAAISDAFLKGMAVRQDDRFVSAVEMQRTLRRAFNSKAGEGDTSATEARTEMMPALTAAETETWTAPGGVTLSNAATDVDIAHFNAETQVMHDPALVAAFESGGVEEETLAIPTAATAAAAAGAASPATRVVETAPGVAQPLQKKKGKTGLVVGGLVGLLLLAGLAAGGGWFAYTRYYVPSQAEASPTPTAELPTPAPTEEPAATPLVAEANANTAMAANTEVTESDTNTNTAITTANRATTTTETRPSQTTPVARTTPRPPANPTVKATPKPKTGGDRTVILQ